MNKSIIIGPFLEGVAKRCFDFGRYNAIGGDDDIVPEYITCRGCHAKEKDRRRGRQRDI